MEERTLQLSLNSDTFAGMKEDFDAILAKTISNMESKGADEAAITLKLNISLAKEEKTPLDSDDEKKEIVKPDFKHVISSVMQVKAKKTGALSGDYELVWDEDEEKYVMRKIDNGQLSIFDAAYEDEDYPEDEEDPDADPAEANTPFAWLKQFIGEELTITEAMGNYTVRTSDIRIILSSASYVESPFHCSAEKLAPHVGHHVVCVGYGSVDLIVNVAIECEDCCETLFSLDLDLGDEEDEYDVREDDLERYDGDLATIEPEDDESGADEINEELEDDFDDYEFDEPDSEDE